MIERNTQIDDDPEAEQAVNLRFFVLKPLLEKKTKTVAIDTTKPGIQFEIPQICFGCGSWSAAVEMGILGILEELKTSKQFGFLGMRSLLFQIWFTPPDMVDPSSSYNLGQSPFRREYDDDTFSSTLVYSIDKSYADKLVEFALH